MGIEEKVMREFGDARLADAIRETGSVAPDAVGELVRLWKGEFTLTEDAAGRPVLVAGDGRPAIEEIVARLSGDAYRRYVTPNSPIQQARRAEQLRGIIAANQGLGFGPMPVYQPVR